MHARAAVGREFARCARDARGAEVLDAFDGAFREELKAALDEQLLHERVADLDARAFRRALVLEGFGGEDRRAADSVATCACTEQHDLVAGACRGGQVDVLVAKHAHGEGVDEGIGLVGGVEHGFTTDVGQTEAVAVSADTGDDAGGDSRGIRVVDRAESELIHDGDGAGPHRDDVADDAANAGRSPLVRLDVARVVVRFDLERHGPAVADINDASVLADTHEEVFLHRGGLFLAELFEVDLGGLVRAVLRPHNGVHGELGVRGAAAEELADLRVLLFLEAQIGPRLLFVRGFTRPLDRVWLVRVHARGCPPCRLFSAPRILRRRAR